MGDRLAKFKTSKNLARNVIFVITFLLFVAGIYAINIHSAVAGSSETASINAVVDNVTLNVTIPDNQVYIRLTPISSIETANLDVKVSTDNPYGYTLAMSSSSSSLTRTEAIDGAYPTIPTLDDGDLTFSANHWGYKLPNELRFKAFKPAGVQVGYSNTEQTEKTETINFGAKVNDTTPTGRYKLDVVLNAIANPRPAMVISDINNMQEFKGISSNDLYSILDSMTTNTQYTLTDSRDTQSYTVAKLGDGNVWMTRNLAIGCNGSGANYGNTISSKALTSSNSNIDSNWSTPTNSLTMGNSWDDPRIACSSTYGAWYNYATTTAGTITGSSNTTDATKDICPAGWRLPTYSEFNGITSYKDTFKPVTGGSYVSGNLVDTSYGIWQSATTSATTSRYRLDYNSNTNLYTHYDGNRLIGAYVRCILSL